MNILIIADDDLDGAGSALALKTVFKEAEIIEVYNTSISEKIKSIYSNINKYSKIFIVDMHIPDDCVDIVDNEKTIIIDHHESHCQVKDRYKRAKCLIQQYSSTTMLICNIFKKQFEDIKNENLYKLFEIVNDYDSYQLKLKDTLKINAIYGSYNTPRVDKFIQAFKDGLRPYTENEQNAIQLFFNKFREQIQKHMYVGMLKDYSVVGCFADYAINEVAHYALKKTNCDIAIIVNLKNNRVSFRRNKNCNAQLHILAEKLCGGGGHPYSAGGKITDEFLKFTQSLNIC